MFVFTGTTGKVGAAVTRSLHIAAASLLVFGLAGAGAEASPAVAHSQGYKAMSMKDDLAHRSPDIHWPTGFEPEKADLFAHNDLIINSSCERVWTHIIEASRWPTWYPNSKDVEIQGGDPVLRDGTVFRWTTFGLAIESKVHEFVSNQRLGWYGYAPGAKPSFYHSWSPVAPCAMSSWTRPALERMRRTFARVMRRSCTADTISGWRL